MSAHRAIVCGEEHQQRTCNTELGMQDLFLQPMHLFPRSNTLVQSNKADRRSAYPCRPRKIQQHDPCLTIEHYCYTWWFPTYRAYAWTAYHATTLVSPVQIHQINLEGMENIC